VVGNWNKDARDEIEEGRERGRNRGRGDILDESKDEDWKEGTFREKYHTKETKEDIVRLIRETNYCVRNERMETRKKERWVTL
jgi:hypothetical protein